MPKPATIRDVARKAGVGVGTVSRVLNESPLVSEETRQKVLTAITALEYRPSTVARQLSVGKRSRSVGIVVPFFTRPAFVGRLQGVEAALANHEHDLILYNVESPQQRDDLINRLISERRTDSLILITMRPSEEQVTALKRARVPVVMIDGYHPDLVSISIDDVDGGRQATQHLISLGHTAIAFLSDPLDNPHGFEASRLRYLGYREVLAASDIPLRIEYHRQGRYGRHIAYQMTEELLDLDAPPTAIFATSDTQAMGVMEAVRNRGLRIPEDISVIGFDDIEIAEFLGLTTIHQPLYQSGVEGIDALFQLMQTETGSAAELSKVLPVSLVKRGTTGPAPQ